MQRKFLLILVLTILFSASFAQKKTVKTVQKDWLDEVLAVKHAFLEKSLNPVIFQSKEFRKEDNSELIEIDLNGIEQLSFVIDPTPDGYDYDFALWAEAKFISADGKETWLSDLTPVFQQASHNSIWRKKNSSNDNFTIHNKLYSDGVLMQAPAVLAIDIHGKNFVKFVSEIGIVDQNTNPLSSVKFKILSSSEMVEARTLTKNVKEIKTELMPYISTSIDNWLKTPGLKYEIESIENNFKLLNLPDRAEFDKQLSDIQSISSEKEQIKACIKLNKYIVELYDIKVKFDYMKPESVIKAYNDFSSSKGYDKTAMQNKVDEFIKLSGMKINTLSDIEKCSRVVDLSREILLSNPNITDDIVVTKYNLSTESRAAMAPQLGTQPSNWTCQLSGSRSGFDASLIQLSGLRSGNPTEKIIYHAPNGNLITDAMLHWDANRILFTSTDELKRLQVYEVNRDASNFHQVTVVDDQDVECFDASYLPSGKIMACTNIGYHGVPCVSGSDAVGNYSLYDPETHKLRRLTYDQDNNWNATVLKNGKVMYTRWEYTDLTHYYSRIVFTMNPDGTEQRALFGSGSMFPNSTFDMQQLPENSNRFIGVISGHHGTPRSGRLIIFDPTKNRAGVEGMVQELPHSQRPIENLVIDQLVDGVWPQFLKPHPLTDKYFLVTAKLSERSLWGIYLIDIYDNMTLIKDCEGEGYINSIPVRKRSVPVNIPERVPMDLSNASKEATMFIQDIYEGQGLKGVPRGTVKQLRIYAYEYDYLHTLSDHIWNGIQSGWDIKRLLGYVPVEADGSAIFKVPANMPFSIQPVDSLGRAVQWMRSWTIGMPGETVSCVGCHENQNQIAMPKRTIASTIKPHELEKALGSPRAINFEQDIQPILNRACIACHNSEKHTAGIDYTGGRMDTIAYSDGVIYSKSYLQFHPYFYRQGPETEMEVLNPYEYSAYNSEMLRMLRFGHHGVKLTDSEMRILYMWLDMNMPYNNTALASPHKIPDGTVVDQKARRRELMAKYSLNPVDWEAEVREYQKHLDSLPAVTPVMPERPAPQKVKEIKVKGFPFTAEQAKAMQGNSEKKIVELAPGISLEFVRIPAGTYIMGNDKVMSAPKKKVTIKKPFWMATTELTNAQVRTMIPSHDSRCIGQHWKDHTTPGYPVNADTLAATKISLDEAMEFCQKMSEKTGMNVTVPTEEQWEWAARAGSDNDFWYGNVNSNYGEYDNMGDSQLNKMAVRGVDPKPIPETDPLFRVLSYIPKDNDVNDHHMLLTTPKHYKANPWGLYDMNGNVAEWTKSVVYPDPTNTNTPEYVVRGGSWYDRAKRSTCSSRRTYLPWIKVWNTGLRVIIED